MGKKWRDEEMALPMKRWVMPIFAVGCSYGQKGGTMLISGFTSLALRTTRGDA